MTAYFRLKFSASCLSTPSLARLGVLGQIGRQLVHHPARIESQPDHQVPNSTSSLPNDTWFDRSKDLKVAPNRSNTCRHSNSMTNYGSKLSHEGGALCLSSFFLLRVSGAVARKLRDRFVFGLREISRKLMRKSNWHHRIFESWAFLLQLSFHFTTTSRHIAVSSSGYRSIPWCGVRTQPNSFWVGR